MLLKIKIVEKKSNLKTVASTQDLHRQERMQVAAVSLLSPSTPPNEFPYMRLRLQTSLSLGRTITYLSIFMLFAIADFGHCQQFLPTMHSEQFLMPPVCCGYFTSALSEIKYPQCVVGI